MENCVFCNIVQGKIPAYIVYQDEKFIAFLDIYPSNPGHIILAPKAHFRSIMEMQIHDYAQFFIIARVLGLALLEFGAEGINFLHSMGEAAGQRMPHVILHVIPRYKSDSVRLVWDNQKLDEAKLLELREKIASRIKLPEQQTVTPAPQTVQEEMPEPPQPPKTYELKPRTGGYW